MIFLKDIESAILSWEGDEQPNELYYELSDQYWDTFLDWTLASGKGGYFHAYGAEQVVRAYMELHNMSVLTLDIALRLEGTQEGTTLKNKTVEVLYHAGPLRSAGNLKADDFVTNRFLTPFKQALLYKNHHINIPYYASTEYAVPMLTTYLRDGSTSRTTGSYVNGVGSIFVNYIPDAYKVEVEFGSRKFTVLMAGEDPCEEFAYLNHFNVQETIFLPCSITRKPSTEFESATQELITMPYDIEHKEEITLKTAALPALVADQLQHLCRSRRVTYQEKRGSAIFPADIIIKDYELPRSTQPNSPVTFEMTFEYADTQLPHTLTL
ncbi:MAG: hypothetical protein U0L47_09340 [Paludibacteraceae bacterium]|nr:hypothetical protein [Paludibacteraceae bacterium]